MSEVGKGAALASLALVMLVWGSAGAVTKVALAELPPFLLALLRFAVGSALLLPFVRRAAAPTDWPRLALMGLTGVALFIAFTNLSLGLTTVTDNALIQGAIPAATAAMAGLLLGERLGRRRLAAIGASVAGVALLVLAGPTLESGAAPDPLLGDLCAVGSVLAWAAYTVVGKRLADASGLAVTAYSTALGTAMLVPFAAYDLTVRPPAAVSAQSWLIVLYLGAVASALGFLLWNRALAHLEASQVASAVNLIPLVGVASAALLLGELPTAAQLVGGGLVLGAVWVALRE